MKKAAQLLLGLILLLAHAPGAKAQGFKKGDNVVSAAYGFGTLYQAIAYGFAKTDLKDNLGITKTDSVAFNASLFGPIYLKYEYGITNWLGIGVTYSHLNSKVDFNYIHDSTNMYKVASVGYSTYSLLLRLNLHMAPKSKHLDPYIGMGMGVRNFRFSLNVPDFHFNHSLSYPFIGLEATFGLRAYITPNIGVFGELGLAKSVLQLGVCGKF